MFYLIFFPHQTVTVLQFSSLEPCYFSWYNYKLKFRYCSDDIICFADHDAKTVHGDRYQQQLQKNIKWIMNLYNDSVYFPIFRYILYQNSGSGTTCHFHSQQTYIWYKHFYLHHLAFPTSMTCILFQADQSILSGTAGVSNLF